MKAYLLKTHTQILLPYIFTALHIIYTNTNTEVMQVKSVYISVNAQHFELKYLSQNSGINSVVSPNAHHLALSGSLSQAKWCTIRALYQPADFLHISSHTHTHTLSLSLTPSWSLSTHVSLPALFFFVLCFCIAFGPTAKCKAHIKVLSAPSNLCCHLDVRSLQLPVPGEVQSSNVKGQTQELTGGGSSLAQDGECRYQGQQQTYFYEQCTTLCVLLSVWRSFLFVTGFFQLAVVFIAQSDWMWRWAKT